MMSVNPQTLNGSYRNVAAALGLMSLAVMLGISGCHHGKAPASEFASGAKVSTPADLAIVNAKVWTGVQGSEKVNRDGATGIAIRGNRIVAVGGDRFIRAHIGDRTRVIDAHGKRVIPGITDSHTHIISGGFQLARLNLRDAAGRDEFVRAIATEARDKKAGQWVLGGRWSVDSWADPSSPNKAWIDPVTGDVPVYLSRMDGHSALVNSAALKIAGIDASGPDDPKGGEIERDPRTGEPTGILKEAAAGLVGRHVPDVSSDDQDRAFRRAMRHAASLGVTSVHDMSGPSNLASFERAEKAGELTLRISIYLSRGDWESYVDQVPSLGLDSPMLRIVGMKGFMDGTLGSRTAYMREPFADATPDMPYPHGQLTDFADPPEEFMQKAAVVDSRNLQIAVHSIGDEANHILLNAYEYAAIRNGYRDARHRSEHAQHLIVSDIPRFAKLGVVASMQPYHKADDGRYCEKGLGKERLAGSYAYRQLVDSGALLVFGSDWPVVTLNPYLGLDSAVNAKTLAGNVWLPSHSLTVEEALRCYTSAAARAIHREDELGTLEVGKLADLVILSDDLLTMPKSRIGEIQADLTIVDGKVVFSR